MSKYILSDIHGCLETLKKLKEQLGDELVFAGDLVDRGPDSRGVIDFVRSGGYDCIKGNHEVLMIEGLEFKDDKAFIKLQVDGWTGRLYSLWLYNGGRNTLYNYAHDETTLIARLSGLDDDELDDAYKLSRIDITEYVDVAALKADVEWLKTLPYYLEYLELKDSEGQHLLVTHTTASEVWELKDSPEGTMQHDKFIEGITWDRISFPAKIEGIFNVYGHTPQKHNATVKSHFACVDTGCYFTQGIYNKLSALQFPEKTVFVQNNVEKKDGRETI